MRSRLIRLTSAAAVLLAVAGTATVAATASADPPPALARAVAQPRTYDVTLITGDTVHVSVSPSGQYQTRTDLAPRPGGESVIVSTLVGGGHTYVLPSDAADLVAAGRVDRRLFDVQGLIADGYANSTTSALPVIVQYGAGLRAQALPAATPVRSLQSINGAALSVSKANAAQFWSSIDAPPTPAAALAGGLTHVWLDGKVHASLDVSVPLIGAPKAWAAGYDGTGTNVAILDTGVDATHPDLAGKVVAGQSFVPGVDSTTDGYGHGTHVASIIAGTGAASGGKYRGVAPGARLVIGKVLDDSGTGDESWVIDGMEWAAETEHARIVSMSLGSGEPSDGTDPMSQSVDDLSASTGALFVIAAGNEGPAARTVSAPGAADAAFTVGAVDKSDQLADFSDRGPRLTDYALKPDIVAPGVNITAARAAGTDLGPIVDNDYTTLSGTSMATPHVAGSAAILLQEHPNWTAAQLESALTSTSRDDGYTVYQQGAGRVDVGTAYQAEVVADTEKVDFGRVRYPQSGPPLTKTVTYRNNGTQPATLTLAATGGFAVSPAGLDVPAGGTAQATVSYDATQGAPGLQSGTVTASGAGTALRTPVGAYKEPEGFELSIHTIQRADAVSAQLGSVIIRRVDTDDGQWTILPATGATSIHLDKGVYSVAQAVIWADRPGDPENEAFLVNPEVDLSQDTSITLDANAARKLDISTDRPTEIDGTTLGDWRIPAGSTTPYGVVSNQLPYLVQAWATPTQPVAVGRFLFEHDHLLGTPVISAEVLGHDRQPVVPLHPRYQHYSDFVPKLVGRSDLPVVDVGTGSAADFAKVDVRGKVALLSIGDQALVPLQGLQFPADALATAARQGAAAVFAYGNAGMPILSSIPMQHSAYPLPTVALPADEGAALHERLVQGPATLRIDSAPTVPDVYALSYVEQGSIPAALHRTVSDRALATVHNTFYGDRPISVQQVWGPRRPSVFQPDDFSVSFMALALVDTPGTATRTEHVGPVSATTSWFRSVDTFDLDAMLRIDLGHTTASFLGGTFTQDLFDQPSSSEEHWGEAPTAPGMWIPSTKVIQQLPQTSKPQCAMCRYAGLLPNADLLPLLTASTDAAGHYGELTMYSNQPMVPNSPGVDEWHLYSGGTELPLQNAGFLYYALAPGSADYRLTEHFVDGYPRGGFGTRADTTWTFHSASPTGQDLPSDYDQLGLCADKCSVLPVLFLRYDLGLDSNNRLPAPGAHTVTITAYRQPSAVAQPRLAGLTVATSTDGTHWTRSPAVSLGGGRYRVTLTNPPSGAAVSLKAEAWDVAGNRVEQVLSDAYGLSPR